MRLNQRVSGRPCEAAANRTTNRSHELDLLDLRHTANRRDYYAITKLITHATGHDLGFICTADLEPLLAHVAGLLDGSMPTSRTDNFM